MTCDEMREVRLAVRVPFVGTLAAGGAQRWAVAAVLALVGLVTAALVAAYGLLRMSGSAQAIEQEVEHKSPRHERSS